ncbi:MAG TPA: hypothetical protein VLE44_03100 [Candidatus Saccharimonadales bacterium]|nr:hypothetical protein [Candidatus Saccharimonadales bacterium]
MERNTGIPTSPEGRKEFSIGVVNQVLRGMVEDRSILKYRPINKETYPKDKSQFIPSFILVYKGREFGLFVAGDQQEFTKMGQTMEYSSLVLNVFRGDKVMSSDEITSFLEAKLKRAKRIEKRVEKLTRG